MEVREKCICPMHGEYIAKVCNIFGMSYKSMCPVCEANEKKEEKEKNISGNKAIIREKMESLRIRPEFYEATLENYIAETESQKQALSACYDMVGGNLKKIVLMGGHGTGKTHLSCALLKILGGKRFTAWEISCLMRECYSAKAKYTEIELRDKLVSYPFLVIDEVGRSKGSDAELSFLSSLIDERHTYKKPIMIISNKIRRIDCENYKKKKEACKQCVNPVCIERYLDNDVLSRLNENSVKIVIDGKDARNKDNYNDD